MFIKIKNNFAKFKYQLKEDKAIIDYKKMLYVPIEKINFENGKCLVYKN